MAKRIGTKTLQLTSSPSVLGFAAVGAKKEKEGPLADYFDYLSDDSSFGEKTWEKAETLMQQKAINLALSVGIALSVGLSMLRILTGISILWFLVPGYAAALIMTFFEPQMFTGVAFDSGGVASGPMTTTFLLPLAMGACEALGGNVLTDAFGIVALVAMTPLCTIQLLGLYGKLRARKAARELQAAFREELAGMENGVIYWEV